MMKRRLFIKSMAAASAAGAFPLIPGFTAGLPENREVGRTDTHKIKMFSFWAINAPLDEKRLCRQLDAMKRNGLDGAVFHPRYFPGKPAYLSDEYLQIVSRVILHARDTGMDFWLYDENGWPSGTADGEVVRRMPEAAGQSLILHSGNSPDAWYNFSHSGKQWCLKQNRNERLVDYFNPDVCKLFLDLVHSRYRDGLDPASWEHVEAFFTDEPGFSILSGVKNISVHGGVPWNTQLPERYGERYGRDLKKDMPYVFLDSSDGAQQEIRIRFWEFITDQLMEGFLIPYREWCRSEGKFFTGHLKGEEHPLFQVMMNGSCHQAYQHFDIPGIDSLERFPNGEYYPRQLSSAAFQFGNGRCMVEVMGGSGWGTRPGDVEKKYSWLANHGVTDFVIHQYQYRLNSHAISDWPPSNPNWFNWEGLHKDVIKRVRKNTDTEAVATADLLVVAPYRNIMAGYEPWSLQESNIHNCATYPDTPAGRLNTEFLQLVDRLPGNHHFTDERSLDDSGRVTGNRLFIGNHGYSTVLWMEECKAGEKGQRLLDAFTAAGGRFLEGSEIEKLVTHSQTQAASGRQHAIGLTWDEVQPPSVNSFFLEPSPEKRSEGWYRAEFRIHTLPGSPLGVYYADEIKTAELNGKQLDLTNTQEGNYADLQFALRKGRNRLRFNLKEKIEVPVFAWLKGDFCVLSQSPWETEKNGMIMTKGPWTISPSKKIPPDSEFIAAGWPFAEKSFTAKGTLNIKEKCQSKDMLRLAGIEADAARLILEDRDLGWTWGPDWSFELTEELDPGDYSFQIHIIPNTFNHYGPHHYIDGDSHVISPQQFTGIKNFADREDAPSWTFDEQWRFNPLRFPVEFIWIRTVLGSERD